MRSRMGDSKGSLLCQLVPKRATKAMLVPAAMNRPASCRRAVVLLPQCETTIQKRLKSHNRINTRG